MTRLTQAKDNYYFVEETKVHRVEAGYSGEAVNKLAKFENMYDDLIVKQNKISREMEKLRQEGKERTVKFKQLLANKLTNNNILILFETYGL
jgi:hypothetical protein